MKRIFIFSIVFIALGLNFIFCNLGYAKNVSEGELKMIEAEARKKEIESKQLQAQALQINLELSKINSTIINLAKKIQENEDKLSNFEQSLVKLKSSLTIKEADFTKENQSLVQILAALQNISLNPSESVILQPLSPIEIIRSAILLRETVPFLNDKSSKLKTDLDSIYAQKQKVELALKDTQKQKELLEKQQKEMRSLMKRKAFLRKKIETKGTETKKIAEDLSLKAHDLRDLLEKLERQKELERKKQQEAERLMALKRQQEVQQTARVAKTIDKNTHQHIKKQVQKGKFSNAKGTLLRPVRGDIITGYGQLISKGVTSKGIVYKTRPNAQVVAIFDGTVIFSGPFKGYGNIIIVEHGDGYLSLLAGLGVVDCEPGQSFLAGEPVGTMPNSNNAKLYVEIRRYKHTINPSSWIAN